MMLLTLPYLHQYRNVLIKKERKTDLQLFKILQIYILQFYIYDTVLFHKNQDCAKQVPLLFVLMSGRIWPTSSWSVFMQSVRTNNDLEGWHRGLNSRASGKSGLPFYLLVKFLYREARLTSLQMRLVSERKLKRIQRRQFRNLQTKIFNLWEEFRNGERSAKQLLSAISYLIAPSQ